VPTSEWHAVRGWIQSSQHMVVLTGAGVSAESGVPTFRDALTGLWARFQPEELATEHAFRAHPQRVWDWYESRREAVSRVQPNAAHRAIATYQQQHPGRLTLITQNVDGLHQLAGSPQTIALHGTLAASHWLDAPQACCGPGSTEPGSPPRCKVCGNLRRPSVVWFGEPLPALALQNAEEAARDCDLMLVVGTSGVVYPAAGLALAAHQQGARVVVLNPESTELDAVADACLRLRAAQCLPELLQA
jgi:NAD-dependent deacetylase